MVYIRYHDRFYRIYGIIISMIYATWIIIGLTYNWPLWIIFALPVPAFLIIYLIYFTIRYFQNPKPPEDPVERIEHQYVDIKL
ncbi:MAG: hypothetical protein ACTSSH_00545 [Candidatus Heimdallarchaeota archaeon]